MSRRNRRVAVSPPVAVPFALAALLAVATGIVVSLDATHARGGVRVAHVMRGATPQLQ